jgi:hypothetical protein
VGGGKGGGFDGLHLLLQQRQCERHGLR